MKRALTDCTCARGGNPDTCECREVAGPYYCTVCDEECENGRDCCSDDFPERGDIEETGR